MLMNLNKRRRKWNKLEKHTYHINNTTDHNINVIHKVFFINKCIKA